MSEHDTDRRRAFHEAGRAVMGIVMSCWPDRPITLDSVQRPRYAFRPHPMMMSQASGLSAQFFVAVIDTAGELAEARGVGTLEGATIGPGVRLPFADIAPDPAILDRMAADIAEKAQTELDDHWPAVERVAIELLAKGVIDPHLVAVIVEEGTDA